MINYNTCTTSGVNEELVNQRQQKSSRFVGRTELTVTVTVTGNTNREAPESEGTEDGCRSCVTVTMMWNTNRILIVFRSRCSRNTDRLSLVYTFGSSFRVEPDRSASVADRYGPALTWHPNSCVCRKCHSLGQWKRREQLVPDHWARYDMASDII